MTTTPLTIAQTAARTAAALMLSLVLPLAHAGRPLVTEDAGVLDKGDCEIEIVGSRVSERDLPSVRSGTAQFGCGIGLNTQVALLAGQARSEGARTDALALVGKTALRRLTDDEAGIVIAWAVGADRPQGTSLRHESTEVKLVVTQPLDAWLLHANLGAARSERERLDRTLWSVAAERTGLGPVDAMAEVFGDDRSDPWLNAALRWNVIEGRLMLDGSYGVQLNGGHARLVTLGMKFAF